MKGKVIRSLESHNGEIVWVDFENPDQASCENCGCCGPKGPEDRCYTSGLFRVDGQFLVSAADSGVTIHQCMPQILTIYEWKD